MTRRRMFWLCDVACPNDAFNFEKKASVHQTQEIAQRVFAYLLFPSPILVGSGGRSSKVAARIRKQRRLAGVAQGSCSATNVHGLRSGEPRELLQPLGVVLYIHRRLRKDADCKRLPKPRQLGASLVCRGRVCEPKQEHVVGSQEARMTGAVLAASPQQQLGFS